MHLVVMPSAKALIGQYEVFVETKMTNAAGKKIVFRYKDDDTVCVLFNAWCKGKILATNKGYVCCGEVKFMLSCMRNKIAGGKVSLHLGLGIYSFKMKRA